MAVFSGGKQIPKGIQKMQAKQAQFLSSKSPHSQASPPLQEAWDPTAAQSRDSASSHPRVILPRDSIWRNLRLSKSEGVTGIYWAKARASARHPTNHILLRQTVQAQKVSGAEAEEDGSIWRYKRWEMIFLSNIKFAISPTLHTQGSQTWYSTDRHAERKGKDARG